MQRFFFDISDNGQMVRDTEGTELADLEAARNEALATLGGIARDELPDGDRRDFVIEVHNGADGPRLTASLSVRVERKG